MGKTHIESLADFNVNEANYINNQVLSRNTITNKFENTVAFNVSAVQNTIPLRNANGCVKSADPVDNDDVTTKSYLVDFIATSLNSSLFQDSSTINFSTDLITSKMYADVIPAGTVDGTIQVRKNSSTTPTLSSATYISEDYVNGQVGIKRDGVTPSSSALLVIAHNNNVDPKPCISLETIQYNQTFCPKIVTHTYRNSNSSGLPANIAKVPIVNGQYIYQQEHYAANTPTSTLRAIGLNVVSDSDWSTATKKCHIELVQRVGSTESTILRTSPEGNILATNAIKVGDVTGTAEAGMIRWNGANVQGFNGAVWNNLDTSVLVLDNVTVENDSLQGLRVKNGGLTIDKFNASALKTFGSGNTKITTENYVDSIASYIEIPFTNETSVTNNHNKGRFVIPEVYVIDNGAYVAGSGVVSWSADKNSVTITFGQAYSGFLVIRG